MNSNTVWNSSLDRGVIVDDPERAKHRAIRCLPDEIADYVLLPGDPGRAAMIAEKWLDDGELMVANREFHSYTGNYKNLRVSVISTGLGSPGAGMVVQDLVKLGAKAIIRVGTAGSAIESVKPGDIVIASGAVRDEGVSHKFIPTSYPAVPDPSLNETLRAIAYNKLDSTNVHTGIIHTSDTFSKPNLADEQSLYSKANVLAFEMETATVLTLASINKLAAGSIVSIDGYVSNVAAGNTTPDSEARNQGVHNAIEIALECMLELSIN